VIATIEPGAGAWRWRRILIAVGLVAAVVVAKLLGADRPLTDGSFAAAVVSAGALGVLLFCAAFAAGTLVGVPGVVFVVMAQALWGPTVGFVAAYLGAVLAVLATFVVVRRVGGRALTRLRWRPLQRVLGQVERRPHLTMIVLRTALAMSPPLNYALALSPVRLRSYAVASAIGLVVPILAMATLAGAVVR